MFIDIRAAKGAMFSYCSEPLIKNVVINSSVI